MRILAELSHNLSLLHLAARAAPAMGLSNLGFLLCAQPGDTAAAPAACAGRRRGQGQGQEPETPLLFLASPPTCGGSLASLLSPPFGSMIQPWHSSSFPPADPKALPSKELRVAIPILQTRKPADCHSPKGCFSGTLLRD